jgi:hypothetical protein
MSEADPPIAEQPDEKKQRKKAKKTREAWISFAGRVVAQIVGAMASVLLGILVVRQYQKAPAPDADTQSAAETRTAGVASRANAPRRAGEASIAVLPLANCPSRRARSTSPMA